MARPVLAAPHRRSDGAPASPLRYSAPRVFDTGFPARLSPTRRRGCAARAGSDGARWELRVNLRRPCAFAIACGWRTQAKPRRRRAGRN